MTEGSPPKLEMLGITKSYGAVRANRGIDFAVRRGEIVGLLGENGSGKSTLMKILFGMVAPDDGRVVLDGKRTEIRSPADALAAGIGMVHQHFMLVEAMSVAENVLLALPRPGLRLDVEVVSAEIRKVSRGYGLDLDPTVPVEALSFGMRQRVEILKLILGGAKLLILDEPTSNLSGPEVARLLAVMRQLAEEGRSVVFISHKLGEVLEVCDSVVVLRDGAVAGRRPTAGASREDLARMMVGREVARAEPLPARDAGAPMLEAVGLSTSAREGVALADLGFSIRAGEILAIAGIDGNGQTELAEVLAGMRGVLRGRMTLGGRDITAEGSRGRLAAGLAYIPVDRAGTSLVPGMSVGDNLMLRDVGRPGFSRFGWIDRRRCAALARERIARYAIRCAGPDAPVRSLSGGNQQKVVVARELGRDPKALVAVQPTWGLDPGSTGFVLDAIRALREAGGAVLYVSAELEEVLALGDRIAVLHEGRLSTPMPRATIDLTRIGLLMAGDRAAWAEDAPALAA